MTQKQKTRTKERICGGIIGFFIFMSYMGYTQAIEAGLSKEETLATIFLPIIISIIALIYLIKLQLKGKKIELVD